MAHAEVVGLTVAVSTNRLISPQGTEWTVRRKWVPRRLTWRGKGVRGVDVLDGADVAFAADDLPAIGIIGVVIAVAVFSFLAVVFVLPALVFVLELLLIVVLVGSGVAARVLFRRPWTVEAKARGADHAYEWKVAGWQASGDTIDEVAGLLRATGQPSGGTRVPPGDPG